MHYSLFNPVPQNTVISNHYANLQAQPIRVVDDQMKYHFENPNMLLTPGKPSFRPSARPVLTNSSLNYDYGSRSEIDSILISPNYRNNHLRQQYADSGYLMSPQKKNLNRSQLPPIRTYEGIKDQQIYNAIKTQGKRIASVKNLIEFKNHNERKNELESMIQQINQQKLELNAINDRFVSRSSSKEPKKRSSSKKKRKNDQFHEMLKHMLMEVKI